MGLRRFNILIFKKIRDTYQWVLIKYLIRCHFSNKCRSVIVQKNEERKMAVTPQQSKDVNG